ncbi:putative gegh 16 protein [Mycena kentingensis (nom. inval.)]|nr:putative gegh 16 protein [Mycena kentingensis (nom. inval.)]
MKSVAALSLLSALGSAYGHAVIQKVIGANGVETMGFGVDAAIPRTGTSEQPFQLDTPVLKNLADDPCGATLEGGSIDIATALATAIEQGSGQLPSFTANGSITMEIHQVNADGGGPFSAMVNAKADGVEWVPAIVLVQAPGINGILHGGPANVPFVAKIPDGTVCSGGVDGQTCLIRINNGGTDLTDSLAQGAGPFGGCMAVTQSDAAATASTTTAAAATSTTAATNIGNGRNRKNKNKNNNRRVASRFFYPSIQQREELVRRQRVIEDLTFLAKRGELTVDLIDEIKTATGTAIDIPIDMLAGHDDSADLGGNSTAPAAGAVLTEEQATDLKKAVQLAIASALTILSQGETGIGGVKASGGQNLDDTAAANAAADAALLSGELTSINLGNAGVADPRTAVVDSLLGPLATLTQPGVLQSTATVAVDTAAKALIEPGAQGRPADAAADSVAATAAATTADAAATTTAATRTGNGNGRNRNGGGRNRNRNRQN